MREKEKYKTIFDPIYGRIVSDLVEIRHEKGLTQRAFAAMSGYNHCFIAKVELKERRLDFVELVKYMKNLGLSKKEIETKVVEWLGEFS